MTIAPRLLGAVITNDRVRIRLTEVEAYGGVGEDPGSHAFRGQTPRTTTMFGPVGRLYIYFTYGMHWCANIVAHRPGEAGAILLRAGEVIEGIDLARRDRALADHRLASGPARLARSLGLTGAHDGNPVEIELSDQPLAYNTSNRTGVSGPGGEMPWRFYVDHKSVSPYRAATRRERRS